MSTDINELSLLQEEVQVDQTADSEEFFSPKLAEDGEHLVLMKLGDRGVKAARQWEGTGKDRKQTGSAYLNIHLQLKELGATGGDGPTVAFDQLTTLVMQSSGTSRAHAAFDLAGFKLTERTLGGLKTEIERALAQSPRVKVVTQWEAQVNTGSKDSPKYETVLRGQKNFPPRLSTEGNVIPGKFDPEVTDPKSGQTVRAQVRVVKYARA